MSLRVWLPLNGNLNNQGLDNVTVTNSGATVNAAGKIGSCYSFDGSDDYIALTGTAFYNTIKGGSNPFSITFWIYHADSTRAIVFGDYSLSGAINFNIELTTAHALRFYWGGSPDKNFSSDSSVGASTWTHIVITYDGSQVLLYKNGSVITDKYTGTLASKTKTSGAFYLGRDSRTGNTALNGRLNDFRLYDHCLSPKEVKEIAQGLVVHYKLDDEYSESTTNLASVSADYSNKTYGVTYNLNGWGGDTGTYECYGSGGYNNGPYKVYHKKTTGTGGVHIKMANDITLEANKTYTMSVYVKASRVFTDSAHTFNINRGSDNHYITYGQNVPFTLDWVRLVKTFTTTSSEAGAYGEMSIVYNDAVEEYDVYYSCFQIEEKDHATPWVNGTRNGKIYDCSGYGNDGTITGSLSMSSSTPRYSTSTNFAAVGDYISRDTVTSECKTASVWCYVGSSKPSSNSVLFADYNSKLSLGFYSSGTQLITSCSGTSFPCVDTTDIKLNSWNHLVLIHDGSTSKVYINGVLQTNRSNTNYWTHSTQTLMVASRSSGNGFVGQLSDFRMYATALSDADIKELYDTAASIDDGGNLHDFECVEDEVDKAQVLKTGIVKTNNFIEISDKLKVLGDGSVFLQILHHNNPASNLFTVNNCWLNNTTDLYSALLLLKDSSWFTSLSEYEFLICEKLTSTGTESQYRWKQTSNPSTSSTLSGYTVISGSPARSCGLMNKGTYAAMHNGASWWTACGSYSAYQGGIPGVAGVITTGYLDLYVRIPDEMIKGALSDFLKMYKESIVGKQMIER